MRLVAVAMIGGLPIVTYYLWACLTYADGAFASPSMLASAIRAAAPTATSLSIYGAWLLLQAGLQIAAPGRWHEGTPLADGSRLSYRLNGWFAFWATWAIVLAAVALGWISPAVAYDQFGPLLTTAHIAAFALAAFLFWWGSSTPDPARTGDPLDDYLMGVALNPRVGAFDLKYFCEGRPGPDSLGRLQRVLRRETVRDLRVRLGADAARERLSVPLCGRLLLSRGGDRHDLGHQARALRLDVVLGQSRVRAVHIHDSGVLSGDAPARPALLATIGIVALNMAGYAIFRGANIQKHRFRTNPDRPVWGRPAALHPNRIGALLLTSGWWGYARHLNYLGDLMMGLAWCLPAGFARPVPYFYIAYFSILLLHRERRDHAMCAREVRQRLGGLLPEGPVADRSRAVLSPRDRALQHLLSLQRHDGAWEGEVVWCTMILSQYVIVCHATGRRIEDEERREMVRHYARTRTAEGGWGLHPEGAAQVFTTALAYVALRLLGAGPDDELTRGARAWLRREPGVVLEIPTWGKFWLSLLQLYGREGVGPLPPELFTLPDWMPFHPRRWYCHTRYIYLGMSYLSGRGFSVRSRSAAGCAAVGALRRSLPRD